MNNKTKSVLIFLSVVVFVLVLSLSIAVSKFSGWLIVGRKSLLHCLAELIASLLNRSTAFVPLASLTVLSQIRGAM